MFLANTSKLLIATTSMLSTEYLRKKMNKLDYGEFIAVHLEVFRLYRELAAVDTLLFIFIFQ